MKNKLDVGTGLSFFVHAHFPPPTVSTREMLHVHVSGVMYVVEGMLVFGEAGK